MNPVQVILFWRVLDENDLGRIGETFNSVIYFRKHNEIECKSTFPSDELFSFSFIFIENYNSFENNSKFQPVQMKAWILFSEKCDNKNESIMP